jgi:hypothetical protein
MYAATSAVIALVLTGIAAPFANAQNVPCWYVPNGVNVTTQCANGFWQTITPEGEIFTGNGMTDPSATAQGSGLINKPVGTLGPNVTAPTQVLPMLEPYQAGNFGFMPRQD